MQATKTERYSGHIKRGNVLLDLQRNAFVWGKGTTLGKAIKMNFGKFSIILVSLHFSSLCSFSALSTYSSNGHSTCQPCPWVPEVPALCLSLWAEKAPCLTGVNHIRKALEEVCWAAGLLLLIGGILLDGRAGAVGDPETTRLRWEWQRRAPFLLLVCLWGLRKGLGVPFSFLSKPTVGKEWTSSPRTPLPSKFHFLSHPQVRMSH